MNSELIYTTIDSSLVAIITGIFDWESSYSIKMEAIMDNTINILIDESSFYTDTLPNRDIIPFIVPETNNNDDYYPGYNFIDDVVIDKFGEVVLFMPPANNGHFTFTEHLDNGRSSAKSRSSKRC